MSHSSFAVQRSGTTVSLSIESLPHIAAELFVIPLFEEDRCHHHITLESSLKSHLIEHLDAHILTGFLFGLQVVPSPHQWRTTRLMAIGGGRLADATPHVLRKLAAAAGYEARRRDVGRIAFLLRGHGDSAELAQAIAEGLTLSEPLTTYKRVQQKIADHLECLVVEDGGCDHSAISRALTKGSVLGECTNLARALTNEPGNHLTPRTFVQRATDLMKGTGVEVLTLGEDRLAELGMELLLSVAKGSSEPARLMVFTYDPPSGAPSTPVLGLVGKGITFDAGGLSVKSGEGRERMKYDMAGGAAVACAMRAIATLGASIRVIGVVPLAENMPGGGAMRPGDIVSSAAGLSVEVVDTDAEGRLVLADGLWYARQLGATHLVDVATLTFATITALGRTTSGLFGSPPHWVETIRQVAECAGERLWPLPLFDDYREQLKSDNADILNAGRGAAGAITAALFLKEFSAELPWAHLDIAGTAWADESRPFMTKGPTGVAVRTLALLPFTEFQ